MKLKFQQVTTCMTMFVIFFACLAVAHGSGLESNQPSLNPEGGVSWQQQISGTNNALHSVHFVNENVGWVVGEVGTIRKSVDGGITWQPFQNGFCS